MDVQTYFLEFKYMDRVIKIGSLMKGRLEVLGIDLELSGISYKIYELLPNKSGEDIDWLWKHEDDNIILTDGTKIEIK